MTRKRRKQKQQEKRAARLRAKKQIKKKVKVKKKEVVPVPHGRVYIKASFNNTIVTFTDLQGNVLAISSAGQCGFKGPKKTTPYAANVIVEDAVKKIEPYGLKTVDVFVKGVGPGRDGALRALYAHQFDIQAIHDITPIPHNGCRPPKARRV